MQFSGLQYRRWQQASLVALLITILTGCQRPESGQQPGMFQLPMEYLHLMQTPLPAQLPVPVQGVKPQQIADTWGAARSQGRSHEGIDIMAERGTKVLSATMGVVVDMRNNNLGGKVIWIAGPAGSYHYYAHLDKHKRGLNVGDRVKKGQVIGYVGNTGNARGGSPHLHYGIYLSGKGRGAVNPYLYLFKS